MEITSVNNSLVKDTVKLHQKKYRDMFNLFIIEGYHLYEEAINNNIIKHVFTKDRSIKGDNVHYVTTQVLAKMAKTKTPQDVLCVCNKLKNTELADKILVLEGIQDPGNLGTLLRSALAFSFNTIILDNSVDIYNDKVIRATQGAMFKLNFLEMKTTEFIENHSDYQVYGTSFNGEELSSIKPSKKIAVVLGNEGQGISNGLLRKTFKNITIKTTEVESLNVGVAGSIIMHYLNNN